MSLNIENRETEELAASTSEALTGAVAVALRERLEQVTNQGLVAERSARIRLIGHDAAGRWTLQDNPGDLL